MKPIEELTFPEDLLYAQDHEWIRMENGSAVIGISDYAQDQLGDIVYVELPLVGQTFAKGEAFGTVESVKAVSELYMPIGGEVSAVNETLGDSPEKVNQDPYQDGWMIQIALRDPSEKDALMAKDAYLEMLKGLS